MERLDPRRFLIGTCIACIAAASAVGAEHEPRALRIGLIPELNVFAQVERYERFAEHLSAELGSPVRLTMLSRYGNIVERILSRDLQLAILGSFTGTLAISQLGMEPVARLVNADGTSGYFGLLFVRRDSGIRGVDDMKGKRLALVDRATTAGYVFPKVYFLRHGIDALEGHFAEVNFWGSHDAAIRAVLDGRADVGAAKNTVLEWLAGMEPTVTKDLRILAKSPPVPANGLFVISSVGPTLSERLRLALLSLDDGPQGREILRQLGARSFEAAQAGDYFAVSDLAAEVGIDIRSYDYVNE